MTVGMVSLGNPVDKDHFGQWPWSRDHWTRPPEPRIHAPSSGSHLALCLSPSSGPTSCSQVSHVRFVTTSPSSTNRTHARPRVSSEEISGTMSVPVDLCPSPGCLVVVFRDSCLAHEVLSATDAGAAGFLLKDLDPAELPKAVRATAAGIPRCRLGWPRPSSPSVPQRSATEHLTPRGREVLVLLRQGLTNQGIARRLGIAEKTVKGHLTSVFESIGVADRVQTALWAQ